MGQDDEDGEDDADEALGEDVEGAAGGEGLAEEGVWCGSRGRGWSAVRFANAHLSDNETIAKMGHPVLWLVGLFGEPVAIEGEGEPEADERVGDDDPGEDEDAEAGE